MLTHHINERFAAMDAKIKEVQELIEAVAEKNKLLQLRVDALEKRLSKVYP